MENSKPYLIERIVSGLSYPTMGLVGFVWLLLGLFTNAKLRPFVQYHIFQSIFISIALILLNMLLGFMLNILSAIPFLNIIVLNISMFLNAPILLNFSVIQLVVNITLLYLCISAFWGHYSYVPYVSEIIEQNVRR